MEKLNVREDILPTQAYYTCHVRAWRTNVTRKKRSLLYFFGIITQSLCDEPQERLRERLYARWKAIYLFSGGTQWQILPPDPDFPIPGNTSQRMKLLCWSICVDRFRDWTSGAQLYTSIDDESTQCFWFTLKTSKMARKVYASYLKKGYDHDHFQSLKFKIFFCF